ncbi:dihydropteroate synthase [Acidisphaera sp. L21]|uniref:dihydropteroate synthase n=1 Tax=Acidisphaera sp. L21 TaxID=1641851 RepID=UPI00131EB5CA|nr:dihydropteroate synthase [Acidisphaera sp. L21]
MLANPLPVGEGFWARGLPSRPTIMAILNVTPDSFSDGGDHRDPAIAIAAGHRMIAEGADVLDIGGETTSPGSSLVHPSDEQARILPVIKGLRDAGVPISIDTRNAATMAAALDAGATIINDVTALHHDPDAACVVARWGCPVILMHMRGTPATMNSLAQYDDVAIEVAAELAASLSQAERAGIAPGQVMLDPGIGFAKTAPQSVALLRNLGPLHALGRPLLVGVSRKRFIGALGGQPVPKERLGGSLAAAVFALSRGAAMLRVHDVAATAEAIRVWSALTG